MRAMTRDELSRKLEELGMILPEAAKPVANYVPSKVAGGLIYVSGQLPMSGGGLTTKGPVPSVVSVEEATKAARQCVLNGIAAALLVGEPTGVVRCGVFVQSDDGFDGQPAVANGASDLLVGVFGDSGKHARAAVGTNALPLGASVEVELILTAA